VSVLIWYRSTDLSEVKSFLSLGLIIVFFALGLLRVEVANWSFGHSALETEVGESVTLEGIISREPDVRENSTNLYIKTSEDLVLVSVDRYTEFFYGDVVRVEGKLAKPDSFVTDLGRTFDYPGYLKAKGVEYRISFAEVEVLSEGEGNLILTNLLKFKQSFMTQVESLLPEPAAGLSEGLLLGVKQALGEELEAAFRETGIIHVVVLSGYNVMLVVLFVMFVLGYFLSKRPRVIFGILAIILFALMVGLSATVVRASIMASLLLIVQATGRVYFVLRGLILAGLIMIIINPFLLVYDVGFQLSFMATLGLILISPHIEYYLSKIPELFGAKPFLIATLSTQVAVLPLLLYQKGQFSVVAVVVNVLVLPMVPVAMLLTFIMGMVSYFSVTLATIIAYPTYLSLSYIIELAWWFSKLSFASYVIPAFPWFVVPVSYAAMGYVLWKFHKPELAFGEGDLAEKLLHNKPPKEDQSLSDWQIEEEFDKEIPETKKAADKSTAPKDDTPIFFR
jgi:competence protein ComEC